MVGCSDERWGQKESDDLGDNVTWGYTRRIVEFLKEKVNWSSNQVKEGRGEKNREVRARTGKIYSSKHIYAYTHIQTVYLSDVEKCLYVGSHWVSAAGVICPCLYGRAIWHEKSPDGLVSKSLTCSFSIKKSTYEPLQFSIPFLSSGLVLLWWAKSLCLCHLSSCSSFDPSSFPVPLFHMLHSSFVASITSSDIYKEKRKKKQSLKSSWPCWWIYCNRIFYLLIYFCFILRFNVCVAVIRQSTHVAGLQCIQTQLEMQCLNYQMLLLITWNG